jgi:hypothetical protein
MAIDTIVLLFAAAAALGVGIALVADFEHQLLGERDRTAWWRRRLKE